METVELHILEQVWKLFSSRKFSGRKKKVFGQKANCSEEAVALQNKSPSDGDMWLVRSKIVLLQLHCRSSL